MNRKNVNDVLENWKCAVLYAHSNNYKNLRILLLFLYKIFKKEQKNIFRLLYKKNYRKSSRLERLLVKTCKFTDNTKITLSFMNFDFSKMTVEKVDLKRWYFKKIQIWRCDNI